MIYYNKDFNDGDEIIIDARIIHGVKFNDIECLVGNIIYTNMDHYEYVGSEYVDRIFLLKDYIKFDNKTTPIDIKLKILKVL